MKSVLLTVMFAFSMLSFAKSQILISLIFGDKLNSDKIEFGLEGGLTLSNIANLESGDLKKGLNLGFYFDFKLREHFYLHTGVIVKGPMGASNLPTYPVGDQNLDELLEEGEVTRKFTYFYVPALAKYKFDNQIFFEGGPQIGLRSSAKDEFSAEIKEKEDLQFENEIKEDYKSIDFGFTIGVGYKLMKGKGMNIGVKYFLGLTNILKNEDLDAQYNRAIYLSAGIPIGAGQAKTKETTDEN